MNDNVEDLTVRILAKIHEQMSGFRDELSDLRTEMRSEFKDVRSEMTGIRDEMRGMRVALSERIDQTNKRIDNLIDLTSRGHRDHEERIARLESERRPPKKPRR